MLKASFSAGLRDFDMKIEDFTVGSGEILALAGENGAGKSTLLRIISGLLRPESGHIELDGRVLFDSASKVNLAPEKRNIGYMFQNYALFPHMTVYDNIAYGLKCAGADLREAEERVGSLIERMGLSEVASQRVTKLSGGQRQRTALARALAPKPSLLLLDEPISALDVRTQDQIRHELAGVIRSESVPCILVTHSAADALAAADRMSVIEKGKIIASGTPEEVIHNPKHGFVSFISGNLNMFRGNVETGDGGTVSVNVGGVKLRCVTALSGTVCVCIRPEALIISKEQFESSAINSLRGRIVRIERENPYVYIFVDAGIVLGAALTEQSLKRLGFSIGDEVSVTFKATAVQVFV